jgi:putative addiction module component (TIGR02574 family)
MSQDVDPEFYLKLSVARRLQLVDEIMNSIANELGGPPPGPSWEEIERRAAELERDPSCGITFDQLCERLGWGSRAATTTDE